jgi:hypothetical protein
MGLILLSGCLIWIPVGVWVFSIVGWLIMGEIDLITGIVALGVVLGMAFLALNPSTREFSPYLLVASLTSVAMYPFVRRGLAKRESKSMDIEALERAYEALRLRPDNPISKFTIARGCYALGMPGHALRIGENALGQMPVGYFPEEHRTVRRWQAVAQNPTYFEPIACVECQTMNIPGNVHCAACGAPFLLDRARGRVFSQSTGKRLLSVWMALVILICGIPASSKLEIGPQIAALFGMFAVATAMIWLAFRQESKPA